MNYIQSCDNITDLPDTLAIQEKNDMFIIDSKDDTIPIFCNNALLHVIEPSSGPIRIKIPPQCHIQSKSLIVNAGTPTNDTYSIKITKQDLNIMPLDITKWNPFKPLTHSTTPTTTEVNDYPDSQAELDEDLDQLGKDINAQDQPDHSTMELVSISLISLIFAIGILEALNRFRNYKINKNNANPVYDSDAVRKVSDLELQVKSQQVQINAMKGNILTELTKLLKKDIANQNKQEMINSLDQLLKANEMQYSHDTNQDSNETTE